ncbi:hypothetical protein GEM_4734 [Burkholderia cepacia GG4]|uniref:Transposase n=1 Tax=Burkholderia cepacia GG4 TaxID=1009846 RepID=A0A9W3K7R3_BURCE|nr:hypothetical protein GEM_4734 [Burkholderia cepacia GG4]
MNKKPSKFSPEVRERAVRLVRLLKLRQTTTGNSEMPLTCPH